MTQQQIKTTRKSPLFTALLFAALTSPASADILYVDDDGLECPYPATSSIQYAVNFANDGDEIHIYPGTYTGSGSEVVLLEGKELQLIGISTNPGDVLIDGQGQRRCMLVEAPDQGSVCLWDLTLVNGKAVTSSGIGWKGNGGGLYAEGRVNLHDCTVRDCQSDGDGGGIASGNYSQQSSSLSLYGCTVEYCFAAGDGGGVYLDGSSLTVGNGCSIIYNHTEGRGGGVAASNLSSQSNTPSLLLYGDYMVSGNKAEKDGGGIFSNAVRVSVLSGEISDNLARNGNGGGISVRDARLTLGGSPSSSCLLYILENEADKAPGSSKGNGGGVHVVRGSVWMNTGTNSSLVVFFGNGAHGSGGALFTKDCDEVSLQNAEFEQNGAYGRGGAMAVTSCDDLKIESSTFLYNAGRVAGALYIKDAGSGIQQITDVGFLYNLGITGGGMNGAALVGSGPSTVVEVSSCNFWQNTATHVRELQQAKLWDLANTVAP